MKNKLRILLLIASIFMAMNLSLAQWVQTSTDGIWANCFAVSDTNLFVGTFHQGVLLSTNNGISWIAVNRGLPRLPNYLAEYVEIKALAIYGTNLLAGTNGSGVFISTNNGTNWKASIGLKNTDVRSFAILDSNLFAGTYGGGIFLSTDNGASWTLANSGMTNTYVYALATSGTNLFAGTIRGVFLSTNNGTNWTAINNGLPKSPLNNSQDISVKALVSNNTNLFAGTYGCGVFLSTNNGMNWTATNTGVTGTYVTSLAVSGTNIFTGTNGNGVLLSTNNGTSRTAVNSGLPTNSNILSFAVLDTNLFAGIEYGVYKICISKINDTLSMSPLSPPDGELRVLLDNSELFPASIDLSWKYATCTIITLNVRLQVSVDSSFSTGIIVDTILTTSDFHESQSYRLINRAGGTTHYWRLALVYPDGSNAHWSDTWKFTTAGGIITGVVFDDLDRDGQRDDGEPGIPNWKLLMSGKAGGDSRTNADGRYVFAGLDSGSYSITTPYPDVWTLTYPDTNLYSFTLGLDSSKQNIDFGLSYPWNSISGRVFEDLNENGRYDSITEHTLPGWRMILSGYESKQLTTDQQGEYYFQQLSPAHYQVKLGTIPPGWESIPSGYEAVHDFYFSNYDNHPDNSNFAVHRIPSRVKIELTVTENLLPMELRKLRFGVRLGATYGIWRADSTCTITDYAEGEYELPPMVGGFLDARFVDPVSPSSGRFGTGSYTDIRQYYSEAQADTYRIRFQPELDYPITFRWSNAAVARSYNGSVILKDVFMQETDMKLTDSLVIADPSITWLKLVAMNPNMSTDEVPLLPVDELPTQYTLSQNYPNPFNPITKINYALPSSEHVKLSIFNMLGQEVIKLVDDVQDAGYKTVEFKTNNLPSGIYTYRLIAGTFTDVKKMLLIK